MTVMSRSQERRSALIWPSTSLPPGKASGINKHLMNHCAGPMKRTGLKGYRLCCGVIVIMNRVIELLVIDHFTVKAQLCVTIQQSNSVLQKINIFSATQAYFLTETKCENFLIYIYNRFKFLLNNICKY